MITPAEAGALELEEPDWQERFEEHCLRWPRLPYYLAKDNAFEAVLLDWRRFHAILLENGKHQPAPTVDGIIALARLKIFPARFQIKDVPRGNETGFQADDHMWLSVAGEQWRITGIEDRMLMLERCFDDPPLLQCIDLNKARWSNYIEAAVRCLNDLT